MALSLTPPMVENVLTLSSLLWVGTGQTDAGHVRTSNQDAFAIDNEIGLWVIADGMGGHAGGNIASEVTVASIMNHVRASNQPWPSSDNLLRHTTTVLTHALTTAKIAIQERIAMAPELHNMGTTVVMAWLCPAPTSTLAIAHVGDSRAYLIREGRLTALTTDHSFVQQLVAEGHISVEDSLTHPKRNVLVNVVGSGYPSIPDVALHPLMPQDIVLLCTNGLTKMLSDADILSIIQRTRNNLEEGCRRLIQQANAQGGKDNTTVLLIGQPSSLCS